MGCPVTASSSCRGSGHRTPTPPPAAQQWAQTNVELRSGEVCLQTAQVRRTGVYAQRMLALAALTIITPLAASLQIKGNASAIFAPLKTLKLSNATLGSDVVGEDGRTVVLLTHDLVASEDGCELAQSIPIFSLTPIKNEHTCLDIILTKGQRYSFKAQGPNDVHLFGYSLSVVSLPDAGAHLPLNNLDAVSSTTTTLSFMDSIVASKIKGSRSSVPDSQIEKRAMARYLFKDVQPGLVSNKQAISGSMVTVDFKASQGSGKKHRVLFEEQKVP
ncbi:hypothetical protein B0H15DRAFT_957274 [Mycena belliarum]|uniref:Nucleoplasmin-like domain-containing protein n=1 Tax=Mycena belliarum TaxID=1033014 RepID=A0AAD6XLQ7_9AGAR|nr:hypothetical protein B0H15DRAFT_957274 [Mycena belliae]